MNSHRCGLSAIGLCASAKPPLPPELASRDLEERLKSPSSENTRDARKSYSRLQQWLLAFALLALCAGLQACAVVRGGPQPPIAAEVLDGGSTDAGLTITVQDVKDLEQAASGEARNKILVKALFAIDLKYAAFRHGLWAERRNTGAVTALLSMGLGVAGTLTDAAVAKTNYAALGTLLTGTTQVIDSKYLFDQTVSALITTMDANRTAIAARILDASNRPIDAYSGYASLRDVIAYYNAGTLTDALITLQDRATVDKKANEDRISRIHALSAEQIDERTKHTNIIFAIKADNDTKPKVLQALKTLGVTDVNENSSADAVRERLIVEYQDRVTATGSDKEIFDALRASGVISN